MVFVTEEKIASFTRDKETILSTRERINKFSYTLHEQIEKQVSEAAHENQHYNGTIKITRTEQGGHGRWFYGVTVEVPGLPKHCQGPWFNFSLDDEEVVYAASGVHPWALEKKKPQWSAKGTLADFDRILDDFCAMVRTWRVEDEFGQQAA